MRQNGKATNRGYSMVELIIVIAIMATLSAMSLVTWRSIDNSKYKKAVSTFESELTTLRTATMAQDSSMALLLYYYAGDATTPEGYYIKRGYCDSTGAFHALSQDAGENTSPSENPNLGKIDYYNYSGVSNPVSVLRRGSITYNNNPVTASGVIIHYNKSDGSIDSSNGAGEFRFYRKNGELITDVHIVSDTGMYHETY
jgi:prepilin-type N-terminal cleavage/methylation domain-containing protein